MPRQSAEARAAAALTAGGGAPRPPKHLSKEAAAVWREIAESKPADWFDPGACVLLENYCELTCQARAVAAKLAKLRRASSWEESKAFERRLAWITVTLSTVATKLRLSVQALVERQSRKILERGQAPITSKPKADRLIGGEAVYGQPQAAGRATKPN